MPLGKVVGWNGVCCLGWMFDKPAVIHINVLVACCFKAVLYHCFVGWSPDDPGAYMTVEGVPTSNCGRAGVRLRAVAGDTAVIKSAVVTERP